MKQLLWSVLLAAIMAAGGALFAAPAAANASAGWCSPIARLSGEAHGNALPMRLLKAQLELLAKSGTNDEGAKGIGPVGTAQNLLEQLAVAEEISRRVAPSPAYASTWRGDAEIGCAWPIWNGASLEVVFFDRFEQRLAFSPGVFDFANKVKGPLSFSIAEEYWRRRGATARVADVAWGDVSAGASLSVWELVDRQQSSLIFAAKNFGGYGDRWTALSHVTTSAWDPRTVGAPKEPFTGNGFALDLDLRYRPAPWLAVSYKVDSLLGRERTSRILESLLELDTDTEFIGPDGYIWNRPTASGVNRWLSQEHVLKPRHAFQVDVGVRPALRMRGDGLPWTGTIESVGIVLPFQSGSEAELFWRAETETVQGTLSLSPLFRRKWASVSLKVSLDNLSLLDAGNASFVLEGALSF